MAQLPGVTINKLQGGLGRRNANTDNVVALVAYLPESIDSLPANQAKQLLQLSVAESAGINSSYDANNQSLVYHHLSELFRLSPDATVYLIPVDNNYIDDTIVQNILPAIRENQDIRGVGFVGFDNELSDIQTLVGIVQEQLINTLFTENRYIDFCLLEGKAVSPISASEITNLREQTAAQVSVIIAQDPAIAGLDDSYQNYAAVGAALGMLSVRAVNENIGSVNIKSKPAAKRGLPDYPLTDRNNKLWLDANLSDGSNAHSLSKADLKILTDKGYIYASSYERYGGIFFSNSPTCIEKMSDYSFIENNRVWNKAARTIRQTLIPEIKGTVKKDPQTGFIRSTTISRWQALLNAAMEQLIIADEISGFDIYIDPNQYLSEDAPLRVKAQVVKDDIVHEFEIDLGFTQQIQ